MKFTIERASFLDALQKVQNVVPARSTLQILSNALLVAEDGGLTLTVGSTVDYAAWVNDGHWANPSGVNVRFVPGTWSGDRFIYQPGAKGGMVLRQQWVEGYHFWESGLRIIEKMMPKLLEVKLQEWLDKYFAGF